jgi:hypothetical protein
LLESGRISGGLQELKSDFKMYVRDIVGCVQDIENPECAVPDTVTASCNEEKQWLTPSAWSAPRGVQWEFPPQRQKVPI